MPRCFSSALHELYAVVRASTLARTYGEILPASFDRVFALACHDRTAFVDIGSGDGKLLVAAAARFPAAIGIEKYRDRIATCKANLRDLAVDLQKRVTLIEADCNDEDLSVSLASLKPGWQLLLFCNNVAFPPGLNKRLAGNVNRLMDVWPQRVCFVSALPLDELESAWAGELPFQTSWNTLHTANVYINPAVSNSQL